MNYGLSHFNAEANTGDLVEREAIMRELNEEAEEELNAFSHLPADERDEEAEGLAWCLNPVCGGRTDGPDELCDPCKADCPCGNPLPLFFTRDDEDNRYCTPHCRNQKLGVECEKPCEFCTPQASEKCINEPCPNKATWPDVFCEPCNRQYGVTT